MMPVYLDFVDVLQGILQKVFDSVLTPILEKVFNWVIDMLGQLITDILTDVLLDGYVILLKLVNFLAKIFSVYSGEAVVTYGAQESEATVLEYLFGLNGVGTALALMTIIGTALAFLFAIYQTAKSMSDYILDGEAKPISKVLANGMKSAVTFMIIPIMCIVLLQLSNIVLDQIEYAFDKSITTSGSTSQGVDDIIFKCTAEGAAKSSATYKKKYANKTAAYQDKSALKSDFTIKDIDYVMGYVSCLAVSLILVLASISFIRRCFDLLILYLVSPVFSATIALDGGGRFAKWRNQFVGKFFSAFGSVFAMRLYLIIIPEFNNITFSNDSTLNGFVRIAMIIGGAWAVYKGQDLIGQVMFNQSMADSMGAALGLASGAGHMVGGAARGAFNGIRKK